MPHKPPYKIGLGSQVLSRAKIILGSLLLIFLIITIAAIHQGVASGDFNKIFLSLLTEPSLPPSPTLMPSATPSATLAPIKKPAPVVQPAQPAQPVYSNCIRKNIREGEFASNKCYLPQDYEDLDYYLNQYNSAVSSVSFYQTKVNISCGNNDFFKTCDQDKKEQQANSDNIPRYRSIIQGIIAKGK